jgi:outer membrane protein OmpA-like peptidoglycan-associated protein
MGAQLYAPTGKRESFTGDGKVRVVPRVQVAGQVGVFEYSGRIALNYRAQRDWLDGTPIGTELAFAATAGISASQRALLFGAELWGSTVVINHGAFDKATTPLEFSAGVHWRPRDFRAGLGVGPGLTRGYGSPVLRVLAMVEWAPQPAQDRDHDGILDSDDACPNVPGVASPDPRENGCPSRVDTDLDGILDAVDACPTVPGVPSEDPAKNGCPVGDRDQDGVIEELDACPEVPGVASTVPERNGCPLDEDKDGILIPLDACPTWPGPAHDDPTTNGCPLARIEKDQIVITERIEFEFDSAVLLTSSSEVLTAVLNVLREHVELNVVLIEGHTDNIGDATYNKVLSEQRAAAVRGWLISHGVDSARLLDAGFGLQRPIDTNETAEGRQRNRRVEFHIIERDGKRLDTMRTVDEP